jgi:hypothetical protein
MKIFFFDPMETPTARDVTIFLGSTAGEQTSLMNMLACRLAKAKGKGDQMVDGQRYNRSFLKKVSGYVMQVCVPAQLCCDSSLSLTLTVRTHYRMICCSRT